MVGACGVRLGPSRLCPPILPPQRPQPQPLAQPQPQPGFWHSPHSAAAPPSFPSPTLSFFSLFFLYLLVLPFFLFCVGHDVTRRLQTQSVFLFLILLASLSWRDSKSRVQICTRQAFAVSVPLFFFLLLLSPFTFCKKIFSRVLSFGIYLGQRDAVNHFPLCSSFLRSFLICASSLCDVVVFCINLLFASVSFVQRNICHFGVVFYGDAAFRTYLTLCDFESLAGDYTFPITIPRGFSFLFFFTLHSFRTQPSFLFYPQQIYTILNISYCLFLCCFRFLFFNFTSCDRFVCACFVWRCMGQQKKKKILRSVMFGYIILP